MRQLICLAILTLLTTTSIFAQRKKVHWSQLDNNRGKIYQRNHIEPFTGVAYDEYKPGKKKGIVPIKDGLVHGKVIQWDVSGYKTSETTFVKGKKEGLEIVYFPSGKKQLVANYVNDQPHGRVVEYFETGEKLSSGELVNGTENGKHSWWFQNGQLDQVVIYNMGEVNGQVKNWYPDGKLKMLSNYKKNKQHGTTTNWFESGLKMSLQHFYLGGEVDTSSFWKKNGQLKEQKIYNNRGELIQHRDFSEASILIKDGYEHIFNRLESNFILPIKGKTVDPVDNRRVLAFYADGVLIQIYPALKAEFQGKGAKNTLEILENHQDLDIKRLEDMLRDSTEAVDLNIISDNLKLKNGNDAKFWKFTAPGNSNEKKLTLVEEQYLSLVCQNHILLLNALVFKNNKPAVVKAKLLELANSIIYKDKPIDINERAELARE